VVRNDENPARVLEGKYDQRRSTLRDRAAEIKANIETRSGKP
jgi:hypothetical protein